MCGFGGGESAVVNAGAPPTCRTLCSKRTPSHAPHLRRPPPSPSLPPRLRLRHHPGALAAHGAQVLRGRDRVRRDQPGALGRRWRWGWGWGWLSVAPPRGHVRQPRSRQEGRAGASSSQCPSLRPPGRLPRAPPPSRQASFAFSRIDAALSIIGAVPEPPAGQPPGSRGAGWGGAALGRPAAGAAAAWAKCALRSIPLFPSLPRPLPAEQ